MRPLAIRLLLLATLISIPSTTPLLAQSSPQTPIKPMAANAHPTFAVSTVKPHDPKSDRGGFSVAGDRVSIYGRNLATIMMFAYSINKHQVIDLPAWAETASYDIEGTTDIPGEPSLHQQQEMIQHILADRFALKFHHDQRELPIYAIVIAKGGPKLPPPANPGAEPDQDASTHGTETTVTVTSASMADFILGMQFFFDRPLVDRTGLTGRYDFKLKYTFDESRATDPNAPPGLFTAIQEQLGLKLQPIKAPVDVFVIDHIAPPSPN
jgi:uncharacterized protein (TIGR03435 family)